MAAAGGSLVDKLCPTLATPWTVACQAPLSMGFPRQEHWSRLPFPSPGDLSDPGIEPKSPTWQVDSLPSEPPRKPLNPVTQGQTGNTNVETFSIKHCPGTS